jgi:hypothetical protein
MADVQERFIRIAAAKSIDSMTGRADPKRISDFLKNNGQMLKDFPEVKEDLIMAIKSEARLNTLTNRAKNVETILAKQGEFAKLFGAAGSDAATRAAVSRRLTDRLLTSPDQDAELLKLIKVAQGGNAGSAGRAGINSQDAMDGLKASLINSMIDKSRSTRGDVTNPELIGSLNLDKLRTHLFVPRSVGKKPLISVMLDNGVMQQEEVSNIRRVFDLLGSIERAQKPGAAMDVKTGISDIVMSMLARVVGTQVYSRTKQAAGIASIGAGEITVHGAIARGADAAISKLPVQKINNVLIEAMMDTTGEKLGILMAKIDSPAAAAKQARQIHAWLVQSGLTGTSDFIDREYERPAKPPTMFTTPR